MASREALLIFLFGFLVRNFVWAEVERENAVDHVGRLAGIVKGISDLSMFWLYGKEIRWNIARTFLSLGIYINEAEDPQKPQRLNACIPNDSGDKGFSICKPQYEFSLPRQTEQPTRFAFGIPNQFDKNYQKLQPDFIMSLPPKPNSSLTLTAKPDPFIAEDPTTQAKLTLRRDLFSMESEEIRFYALLVGLAECSKPPENGTWDNTTWPDIPNFRSQNTSYQVTPARWAPFSPGTSQILYTLGDGSCDSENRYCNVPLRENTKYTLKVRGFTDSGYQDTDAIHFKTLDKLPVTRIVSVLGGLVLLTAAALCLSIYNLDWIKRVRLSPGEKQKASFSPVPEALSQKSFLKYAEELLSTPGRLGNEFYLLGTLSSDVSTLCLHAQRVDNRVKNRYGNVLPFDMTRVKLSVIDDDPSTDYINASFIRGFKQEVQYIASQGPKEETCHDFYRMILEQNIELIVMLTDLYENEMEKCYKYYPEKDEVLKFKDITISCKEEEDLGVYTRRVFIIFYLGRRFVVTQLHMRNWRDFECPESPEMMVKFCDMISQKYRKGCILVHCSAGAGRTGTFIAIDILLQDLKSNSRINVFDTVLKLRQQRVNMVSTEAQLGYIYKCVSAGIKRSLPKTKETV